MLKDSWREVKDLWFFYIPSLDQLVHRHVLGQLLALFFALREWGHHYQTDGCPDLSPNPDPLPCLTVSNVSNTFSPMLFILIFFEMNIRVLFPSLHTGGKETESYIQRTVRIINTSFLYNVQSSLLKWLFWSVLRSFIVSCHGDYRWLKNAEFGVRLLTFNSCRILIAKNELRATGRCQSQI